MAWSVTCINFKLSLATDVSPFHRTIKVSLSLLLISPSEFSYTTTMPGSLAF